MIRNPLSHQRFPTRLCDSSSAVLQSVGDNVAGKSCALIFKHEYNRTPCGDGRAKDTTFELSGGEFFRDQLNF